MYSRWRFGLLRARPVVSSSSPPDSHGVGSISSEMCTQRTGMSRWPSPARRGMSTSARTSRTVSIGSRRVQHAPRGFLEDRPYHSLDLLELLGPGDQRRRELDHRVAAVVGAADEPAAEQLARHVPAQQLLALLVAEVLLRIAVLDQLDGVEVAGSADVADDLDVAQRLEHVAQVLLVLADVLEQALALEDVDVGHGDRCGDRVPAEGDAVQERARAVGERLEHAIGG